MGSKGIKAERSREMFQAIFAGTATKVTYAGTSVPSDEFQDTTSIVRLCSTTACHVAFGADPTATATDTFLPANTPEYFAVTPGHKVAVIQDTAGGDLYITEGA